MSDIAFRVGHVEEDIRDHKARLEEHEDRLINGADAINRIDQWRNGNGAQGAEARLQCVEEVTYEIQKIRIPERLNLAEADIVALQRVADGKIADAVSATMKTTLDARDRTAIAYIKAFGPYAACVAAIAAALWGRV
jgi:hypothetical protein